MQSRFISGDQTDLTGNPEGSDILGSRFVSDATKILNDYWGISHIDPIADEQIKSVKKHNKFNIVSIDLDDGTALNHVNFANGDGSRTDFIGLKKGSGPITDRNAEAIVSLGKSKGWKAMSVQGSQAEREKLWLAAQRQGMPVVNFEPTPDSAVFKTWMSEQRQNAGPVHTTAPAGP